MIAYRIQLRYVIRDKIQSETKSSLRKIQSKTKLGPRQNPRIFFQTKFFFHKNIFIGKKILLEKFLGFCI